MTTPIVRRPRPPAPEPTAHPGWGPIPPTPPVASGWAPPPPIPPSWVPPSGPPPPPQPPQQAWDSASTAQEPPSYLPPPPDGWDDQDEPADPGPARQPVGLQNLLLGLGTALVAIAVIVFTAVNWSQLDAGIQGLILVALTVAAGVGAALATKRSMPSTAEAMGMVALLLAIADVHAFRVGLAPDADPLAYWAGGLALVSGLAWVLGRLGGIRSPQIAAAVLGQAPLLFVLAALDVPLAVGQLAVVGQALVVLFLADRIGAPRWARLAGASWAVAIAAGFTVATVVDSAFLAAFREHGEDPHLGGTGWSMAAAALLAGYVAWLRAESAIIRTFALLAATALGLAAVWFGGLELADGTVALALVALAASLVVLGGRSVPRAWGDGPAILAGVVGVGSSLPFLAAVSSMLVAASTVSAQTWERSGAIDAAGLQLQTASVPGTAGLALYLVAALVVCATVARTATKLVTGIAVVTTALAALVVSPLLAPLSITGTVLLALGAVLAGTVAATVLGARRPGFPVAAGFVVLAYAWATPWSLATPGLTMLTLGAGLVAAVVIAVIARRDGAAEAGGAAVVWVAAAGPFLAGLATWNSGQPVAAGWAAATVAAVLISVIGVMLLDPSGRADRTGHLMGGAVETTSLVAYLGALVITVCTTDPEAVSVALAAGVLGFGLHAVRPHRRLAALAAVIEALVFTWLQLGRSDVEAVEAYTLPLALALLLIGVVAERTDRSEEVRPSWITYGPALVVALAPTVWLSFTEPGPGRPLAGLVAGAVVLVLGVVSGKRALVDVGTAVVVVLGLRQIVPVVGSMPNWATIGATGVLLLAVGATFEQRRRDLKAAVRKYSALT